MSNEPRTLGSLPETQAVLSAWFGPLDESGAATKEHVQRWFLKDPAFDSMLRERFGSDVERALAGELIEWEQTPEDQVALILVLDQLPRNIFRDTGKMYAGDSRATTLTLAMVDSSQDRALTFDLRRFIYMPLMHAESLDHQERCLALFRQLADDFQSNQPLFDAAMGNVNYAIAHRDIVKRFGRFPHRNTLLGRPSTPEEEEFLKQPGSSF